MTNELQPHPAREKYPVTKDAGGNYWADIPKSWQIWFDRLRQEVLNMGNQRFIQYDSQGNEVIQVNSAFGEQIVAQLHPQVQQSFEYTVSNTELNENTIVGTGTVTQANAMAVVGTGTTTGSKGMLKGEHQCKYKAGMGGIVRFSALFTSPVALTKQYIGIVDEVGSSASFKNGFAIGYNGTLFTISRWQNDVLFETPRSDWDDPLDGTGSSGVLLTPTNLTVFYIQFQYLGGGAINFWVENPKTGKVFIFHTIEYSGLYTSPSTYNPNYFFTMYADNTTTTSNMVVKSGSYGFFIEGKTEIIEIQQPQNATGQRTKATVVTEVAIFTIRNKSSYASKTNFIDILLERWASSIEANAANNLGSVRLVKNATLGGTPSYSDISTTNSVVDIDVSGTTVTGGKTMLWTPLAGKNDKNVENVLNLKFIIHPGETVTLAGLSTNSATINGALVWKELF